MKIALLAAMDKELRLILKMIPGYEEIEISGKKYYKGEIGRHEVVAGKCGIGKVNAALNTLRLIEAVRPSLVINSGVAGGVDGSLGVGSVLIADKVSYHDVWCGPGTKVGAADGFDLYMNPSADVIKAGEALYSADKNVTFGLICSGDRFISKPEEVEEIKRNFPEALAVDMESAAIAQTCISEGVPFAIVRVMSDTPGREENVSQYENFWEVAPEKTFSCVSNLLESLA